VHTQHGDSTSRVHTRLPVRQVVRQVWTGIREVLCGSLQEFLQAVLASEQAFIATSKLSLDWHPIVLALKVMSKKEVRRIEIDFMFVNVFSLIF